MKYQLPADLKNWYAISCPTTGLRFDARTLELMDTDKDGRIRADEVKAAVDYLAQGHEKLLEDDAAIEKLLAENLAKQADLAKLPPSDADKKALADWEEAGKAPEVLVCGEATADAEAALKAVEPIVDAFFTPPDDMPLVTEAPDVELPLKDHLNPKHQEAILAFAEKCVKPVFGEKTMLGRLDWKAVKAAFAPYRAWCGSKPVMNATAKDALVAEEKTLRYRLNLDEFLVNFVDMDALYGRLPQLPKAIFQTGVLRIDGKELELCFHVENEGAHAALAERSKCCIVYAKLTRPSEGASRQICAVVTAGRIAGLYVGRNGVFFDRDGKDWEAVVTKVVESEVSLVEAFWSPWRKLGESVSGMVKKFFGDKDAAMKAKMAAPSTEGAAKEGGAAMASSVAAIGIGIGMIGAAAASLMAAVSNMTPLQILGAVFVLILVVSLPSVVLTWFKLRQRDLGAILNACGWAINRPMRFSMRRASAWTKCAKSSAAGLVIAVLAVVVLAIAAGSWYYAHRNTACCASAPSECATNNVSAATENM